MSQATIEKRDTQVTRAEPMRAGRAFIPAVDILEKPDELVVFADVPGARAEDIDIQFENGQLTLHAKVDPRTRPERTTCLLREYGVADFRRTFEVGEGIDSRGIAAEYRNGVLTLHLPKADGLKPRRISVQPQ